MDGFTIIICILIIIIFSTGASRKQGGCRIKEYKNPTTKPKVKPAPQKPLKK